MPARARRGGRRAAAALVDVILLDSDDEPEPATALARAAELLESAYVVDLAWLRTTPWRERLAASFDPPERPALRSSGSTGSRSATEPSSRASALLLAGWLASRLRLGRRAAALGQRRPAACAPRGPQRRRRDRARAARAGGPRPRRRDRQPARTGTRCRSTGRGRLCAPASAPTATSATWQVLGASRGEGGILGEGVRQALLRDPTYGPALDAARGAVPAMSGRDRGRRGPGRGLRARCSSAPSRGGGHIVLTGGSTPRAAYESSSRPSQRRPGSRDTTLLVRRRALRAARRRALELSRWSRKSLLDPLGAVTDARRSSGSGASSARTRPPTTTSAS